MIAKWYKSTLLLGVKGWDQFSYSNYVSFPILPYNKKTAAAFLLWFILYHSRGLLLVLILRRQALQGHTVDELLVLCCCSSGLLAESRPVAERQVLLAERVSTGTPVQGGLTMLVDGLNELTDGHVEVAIILALGVELSLSGGELSLSGSEGCASCCELAAGFSVVGLVGLVRLLEFFSISLERRDLLVCSSELGLQLLNLRGEAHDVPGIITVEVHVVLEGHVGVLGGVIVARALKEAVLLLLVSELLADLGELLLELTDLSAALPEEGVVVLVRLLVVGDVGLGVGQLLAELGDGVLVLACLNEGLCLTLLRLAVEVEEDVDGIHQHTAADSVAEAVAVRTDRADALIDLLQEGSLLGVGEGGHSRLAGCGESALLLEGWKYSIFIRGHAEDKNY